MDRIAPAPDITASTVRALAALGHEVRLAVFRLLMRAGPQGLTVGDIVGHTGLAPSTLAHHLSALVAAGLVEQDRQGREVWNRARFDALRAVIDHLNAECCAGVPRAADVA
jgi:ArsR family transcriptional regulator, arsenate/arsenite/antimonite-responsive transcriptional repressor